MGLDMNIYKNKTVEHDRESRERTVKISEVLYLRKANQIHHYIVNNFADGKDECQEICMDIEDIKTLNDICKRIVKESKLADGWVYYEYSNSRRVPKDKTIELAEKKDLRFVSIGGVAPSDIKVGDYIWGSETSADKVEGIDEDEDDFLFRCGSECVAKVITNPELAQELLPTQAGFFFGDTNYTEYYIDDLKEYIRQADEIIADYESEIANGTDKYDLDYTYQASW